jgi:hypothetical protein
MSSYHWSTDRKQLVRGVSPSPAPVATSVASPWSIPAAVGWRESTPSAPGETSTAPATASHSGKISSLRYNLSCPALTAVSMKYDQQ